MAEKLSPEMRQRVNEVVLAAMQLSGAERAGCLEQLESERLRHEAEQLLVAHEEAENELLLSDYLHHELEPTEDFHASISSKSICDSATHPVEGLPASAPNPFLPRDHQIGDYRIQRILGVGGYGVVYLAEDVNLHRQVALKLANRSDQEEPANQRFLEEARRVAQLNPEGIVRILHVAKGEDYAWSLVMEYIDGPSLKQVLSQADYSITELIKVFIKIAQAVDYANANSIFHCDLKPGNILLRQRTSPCVVDFGMALHVREQQTHAGRVAGTPAYMSPEQTRGENHRLDGRTDIWSIGVMLYEALTGERPFQGSSTLALFNEIRDREPRPLRQLNPSIPTELERICLRGLSKRMADRYSTAADIAEDLRFWLTSIEASDQFSDSLGSASSSSLLASSASQVVPRGLRPFGTEDADSFVELTPGPRTRNGLPETIQHWIDSIDAPPTMLQNAVNVLYGPSGSGKSSLLRAGILTRLRSTTKIILLDAGVGNFEDHLLTAMRRERPEVPSNLSLSVTCGEIRRLGESSSVCKLLIVIDQFEQWLHANRSRDVSELALGLRHCDGISLQCILTVRSDFWQGLTRFMEQIEFPLIEMQNCGCVDLFDYRHAEKVLTLLGRAYNCLPPTPDPIPTAQREFVEQAVEQIAQDGYVMPVRLALFAEMVKSRKWTTEELRNLGGEKGLGVAFFEQTFDSEMASPLCRRNSAAAQRVLAELLPDAGSNLKGQSQLRVDLLSKSGLSHKLGRFQELISILDKQLRLITPAEVYFTTASSSQSEASSTSIASYRPSYQLTHDYLVPALREWLARKQQETRQGRATACLERRTRQWQYNQESRYLPSLIETLQIGAFTDRKRWSLDEIKMMSRALKSHLSRFSIGLVCVCAAIAISLQFRPKDPLATYLNPSLPIAQREEALKNLDLSKNHIFYAFTYPLGGRMDGQLRSQAVNKLYTFAMSHLSVDSEQEDYVKDSIASNAASILVHDGEQGKDISDKAYQQLFQLVQTFWSTERTLAFLVENQKRLGMRVRH